jgi:hypothetical protein
MDIHKPKPIHGVREFLKEYLIIVIGVLTALGAEQAVEALHWRGVVAEEREALDTEVASLHGAMLSRLDLEPCVTARLADVRTLIARHDAHRPLGVTGVVGRPIYAAVSTGTWSMAVADQSLAHMKLKDKRKYIAAYTSFGIYTAITDDERAAWRSLQTLNHADTLTDADWSQVRKDYEQAVETHSIISTSLLGSRRDRWLTPLEAIPGQPQVFPLRIIPIVASFCRPLVKAG